MKLIQNIFIICAIFVLSVSCDDDSNLGSVIEKDAELTSKNTEASEVSVF